MQKQALRTQFNKLLQDPSEEHLQHFITALKKEVRGIPACPKCGSGEVTRRGYNPRKGGPEQQFGCKLCNHIYTLSSIKTNELRNKYPACNKCGSKSKRSGFWRWTTADGQKKSNQRYECTNSECGHFFSLERTNT